MQVLIQLRSVLVNTNLLYSRGNAFINQEKTCIIELHLFPRTWQMWHAFDRSNWHIHYCWL